MRQNSLLWLTFAILSGAIWPTTLWSFERRSFQLWPITTVSFLTLAVVKVWSHPFPLLYRESVTQGHDLSEEVKHTEYQYLRRWRENILCLSDVLMLEEVSQDILSVKGGEWQPHWCASPPDWMMSSWVSWVTIKNRTKAWFSCYDF